MRKAWALWVMALGTMAFGAYQVLSQVSILTLIETSMR